MRVAKTVVLLFCFALLALPAHAQHQANLAWVPSVVPTGSPAVTSVTIYRSTTSGAEILLQNVPIASLPACPAGTATGMQCFTDTTVVGATTYFYKVTSTNSVGESPRSNELSVTTQPDQSVPNAPTNLTGSAK